MIQCHILLLYYLVGQLTNKTDVCVCNQNWIEKKFVAMCLCNTNAQKCETSVKKSIFLSDICGLHAFNIREYLDIGFYQEVRIKL